MSECDAGIPKLGACPPYVLPATCDAQYLNDSHNCCVPMRDCQGGACVEGKCQPVLIVGDAGVDAEDIGVAGDFLVWATGCNKELRRCTKTGAGEARLPKGLYCTPTMAIGGNDAYWIEWDGPYLNSVPVDGSAPRRVVAEVTDGRAHFGALVVDAERAYWATQENPPGIWYAPLDGEHTKAVAVASMPGSGLSKETALRPNGVAVDKAYLYWSDENAHAIKRRSLSTLGSDTYAHLLVTGEQAPQRLAVDAERIYWVTGDGLLRSRAKVDGACEPTTLASKQPGIWSIVVDDRYVYWTNWVEGGSVNRVRKSGGAVEVLATNQKWPRGLAQDCATIYWTNQNNWQIGEVVKIAK